MPDKNELRSASAARRNGLTPAELHEKSAQIRARLYALEDYKSAPEILTYVSKGPEVDTRFILDDLLDAQRRVLVPIAQEDGVLHWSGLNSVADLRLGAFGVLEPASDARESASPHPDALTIVPCVAFSKSRHRLGHGKGFFDRFLHDHAGIKIGLAFETQRVDGLVPEPHDIPMDVIITEDRVYRRCDTA